jgi:hypothetical protein
VHPAAPYVPVVRSPADRGSRPACAAPPSESTPGREPAEPPQPEMPVDNAARMRQRILAIFLAVTAVLYVSCEALDPKGTDQVVTTVAAG